MFSAPGYSVASAARPRMIVKPVKYTAHQPVTANAHAPQVTNGTREVLPVSIAWTGPAVASRVAGASTASSRPCTTPLQSRTSRATDAARQQLTAAVADQTSSNGYRA